MYIVGYKNADIRKNFVNPVDSEETERRSDEYRKEEQFISDLSSETVRE